MIQIYFIYIYVIDKIDLNFYVKLHVGVYRHIM